MVRRKRIIDDDGSDSSVDSDVDNFDPNEDPDLRAERDLFQNPYQRKRRRTAESDQEEALESKLKPTRRTDWAKAPAFVSGKPPQENPDVVMDGKGQDGEAVGGDDVSNSDDSETSRPPSPRVREEEDDTDFLLGGIGTADSSFTKGGIGSSKVTNSPRPVNIGLLSSVPTAFGTSRTSSFIRNAASSRPSSTLSGPEQAHFNKISNSFGARMLAKMGWQAGTGLGTTGEGIVTPVESKLRPQRAGIAFRGFKEKTEQSKAEARRRGEAVSDDENEITKKVRRAVKEAQDERAEMWKKPKKVKTRVEHRTYEQILAEAGDQSAVTTGIGQIIDATGAVPREINSLADISLNSWTPSTDPTRIPEVRHNIRLIADACKSDLDGLAREAKALEEHKNYIIKEDMRLRKKIEDEAELISRLQQVQIVTNEIELKAKELASTYEISLDTLSPLFYRLIAEFSAEFDKYHLDDIIVAAIAPLVRRLVSRWNPLEDPTAFMSTFRNWRRALRINSQQDSQLGINIYGVAAPVPVKLEIPMSPFESLLWNVWLPKVRTTLNNDWDPCTPQPAVKLYEAWSTFLPPFIRDNFLDQLILPKVQKAISEWKPGREAVSLQSIVFPWLPYVGLRLEDVIGDARRKIKTLLRGWAAGDEMSNELFAWKDVFDAAEWDNLLLKYIVPKLATYLRNNFRVNPRAQNMEPLEHVLEWSEMLRGSIFSQVLETEFFPKWLDVLHIWLIQPKVNFEEVAQWYTFWKEFFPEHVQNMPGVVKGFTSGLQLMNNAIELGADAPTKLPRPDFRPDTPKLEVKGAKATARPPARAHEITFRAIVEEFVASHNLLFIPTGKAHEKSRMPLFRISPTADGKGGLLVYILDDAVWAAPSGTGGPREDFGAIPLENVVIRATL